MHSRLLKCNATSATMEDTMRALVNGLKEAREVHGLKELLARKWCTSALVRARIAVEMCEANAGIARHEQCMHKRCKDAEDAALDAQRLKEELEAQCPHIKFTMQCHRSRANFLDLAIEVERNGGMHMTDIRYRIYRKPGHSMAYLQDRKSVV